MPHKHGGYTYVNNKCYCLSEEKYITPDTSYTISFYDDIYHQITCICGKNGLEKHNYHLTISGKDKRQTCKNCGYWIPYIG
ncbi:MAG: hypothetical protein K2P14_04675 [Anaeroplasmataceae bacterium]|nr:hypothetical protein [Anaeroplasmataceae bacterium]